MGDLELDQDRVNALNLPDSPPNKILRQDAVLAFEKHFSLSVSKLFPVIHNNELFLSLLRKNLAVDVLSISISSLLRLMHSWP
jgi:hypothetical protein